jgi:hypothetical protein
MKNKIETSFYIFDVPWENLHVYIDSPRELMFTLIFHKNLNNVYIDIP